jgi:hypothetical protein
MRLRTILFLMALGTAVPLIAFALLAANLVFQKENESLMNAAKARNRAVMSAVDGVVADAINTLRALSVTPSLDADDLQSFYEIGKKGSRDSTFLETTCSYTMQTAANS